MPIKYKIDVLDELKKKGYSTYRIRREKIFGEATIQTLRSSKPDSRSAKPISWDILAKLCTLLNCQPGDIIYFEDDPE